MLLYRNKWEKLILAPMEVNLTVAKQAIHSIYSNLNLRPPRVIFRSSPCSAVDALIFQDFKNPLTKTFDIYYRQTLLKQIINKLTPALYQKLIREFTHSLKRARLNPIQCANQELLHPLTRTLRKQQRNKINNCVQPEKWTLSGGILDFCFSVLHLQHDSVRWQGFANLVHFCGWVYPYRRTCVVCDRPTKIHLKPSAYVNSQSQLVEIEYSDGYQFRGIYNSPLGRFKVQNLELPSRLG